MLQRANAQGFEIEIPPVFSVALSVVPPALPPGAPPPKPISRIPLTPELEEVEKKKWAAFVDVNGESNPLPGVETL